MVGSEGAVSERFSGGCVNPIQTGGVQILPARTLDTYNFFNKQAKDTKLGDFS